MRVRDYLNLTPNAAVVNLGCGLDGTGRSCDNGSCKIYNLDFPDVIAVRNELLPAGEREENIAMRFEQYRMVLEKLTLQTARYSFPPGCSTTF